MILEDILVRALNGRRKKLPRSKSGLYLGDAEALIGGERKELCVPRQPAEHTFICGRTGTGKTTLLLRVMAEHSRLGVPFLFIDFHGHATDCLLAMTAGLKDAREVVLLEPWSDPVIGWNPLESSSESPYPIVQELINIFHHRLWPEAWGPRLEELLRMSLLALVEAKLTLLEATSFLSRPEFRRAVLHKIPLPEVREFWAVRFERLSPSQRSLVTETVLNKLSVFHDPTLRHVVGQEQSTLDLERALREGQTVLVNLSSGSLRGNNFLLAALLVAKLKAAVYRRPSGAKPYSVFLDEFQEMVALEALDDYLRSFRKFSCSVYLATQHLQLAPELKAGIFGNCARFVCFAASATDAAFLGREFGGPEGNLAAELLPDLPMGQAVVKVRGQPAQLLRALPPDIKVTAAKIVAGRAMSLQLGKSRKEIDAEIERRKARFGPPDTKEKAKTKPVPKKHNGESTLPEGYEGF